MRKTRIKYLGVAVIILLLVLLLFVFTLSSDVRVASAHITTNRATIEFTYNGKSYKYIDNIITAPDYLVAEEIQIRKINAPLNEKLSQVERILQKGGDYQKAMSYCFPLLYKTLDRILGDINKPPKNSTIIFSPNSKPMFNITKEEVGFELESETLWRDTFLHLRKNQKTPLVIKPKSIQPEISAYDNLKLTHKRVGFSTSYANSKADRAHNITLALKSIDGTRLEPGEEFSFNKVVGNRTVANGYREAKIIMDGKYVDGVGGGVCQASTTLYNSAIRADMRITAVKNHSLKSSYVPPSFDAMVNSGTSDLRFVNDGKSPVFIRAYGEDGNAVVEFYGEKLPYTIETKSIIIAQAEPPLDKEEVDIDYKFFDRDVAIGGEKKRIAKGYGALKSEGYLIYRGASGEILDRKLIRKDSYKGLEGKVMIAPKAIVNSERRIHSKCNIDNKNISQKLINNRVEYCVVPIM
ncbi:MAG: VanW family protein [Firmicutes bacterium]|nr:VanW family protein [Bacillota bacterium]